MNELLVAENGGLYQYMVNMYCKQKRKVVKDSKGIIQDPKEVPPSQIEYLLMLAELNKLLGNIVTGSKLVLNKHVHECNPYETLRLNLKNSQKALHVLSELYKYVPPDV